MSTENEDENQELRIESPPDFEDFLPLPKKKGFLERKPKIASLNIALLMFMFCLFTSLVYWQYPIGQYFWSSYNAAIVKKEYWRLLTALFTHADLTHLLQNGFLFIVFGWLLRYFYGLLAFPIFSLALGILTNLISIHFHDPNIHQIGASGMIYGMIAMWIVFYIKYDVANSIPLRVLRSVGFSLAMLFPTSFREETDYIAHGIGFMMGLILAVFLLPLMNKRVQQFYAENLEKIDPLVS